MGFWGCIYVEDIDIIKKYISEEQKNTDFDLTKIVKLYDATKENKSVDSLMKLNSRLKSTLDWKNHDILVEFDTKLLNSDNFQHIVNLAQIIESSAQIGKFSLDIFEFKIKSLKTYEKDLILRK